MSRAVLVQREKKRRAKRAFSRAKQLWIWAAALGFSYADLVTTVYVGMEYLRVGGKYGRGAAHAMFGMLGGSLLVQALVTHSTGERLCASQISIQPS